MTIARSVARSVASPVARPVAGGIGGGGIDQDAAAYFAAVEGAGGSFDLTSLDAAYTAAYVKAAHNTLFTQLKSNGLWSKITELYLLVGKTFDGITIKAKGTGLITSVNFVSGDYVAAGSGAGLTAGTGKYLTLAAMSDIYPTLDDSHLSSYIARAAGTGWELASTEVTSYRWGQRQSATTRLAYYAGEGTADTNDFNVGDTDAGYYLQTNSGADKRTYTNGSKVIDTAKGASTYDGSGELRLNWLGETTPNRHMLVTAGTDLDDTDAANLTTAVETFMDAIGAGVIA